MTGKVPDLVPDSQQVKIRGVMRRFWNAKWQKWVTQAWPVRSVPTSQKEKIGQETFRRVVKMIKHVTPPDWQAAEDLARNSPYLNRDLLYKAAVGTLLEFTDSNGRRWMSTRLAIQNIQPMLDSISAVPGAMLVRGPTYWAALAPGDDNAVMVWDDGALLPAWKPKAEVAEILLLSITDTVGQLLVRDANSIVPLNADVAGYVLTSNGPGELPSWQENSGGGALTKTVWPTFTSGATPTTQAAASIGAVYEAEVDVDIYQACAGYTEVVGAHYAIGWAPFNSATLRITAAPIFTPGWTGTAAKRRVAIDTFATPISLNAGDTGVLFLTRDDATDTTTNAIYSSDNALMFPGLSTTATAYGVRVPKKLPLTTDNWATAGTPYACWPVYKFVA